jgi:hypothetical protein
MQASEDGIEAPFRGAPNHPDIVDVLHLRLQTGPFNGGSSSKQNDLSVPALSLGDQFALRIAFELAGWWARTANTRLRIDLEIILNC